MEDKLVNLAAEYGGVDNLIQALQRLNIDQPLVQVKNDTEENEIIIEVWRGESTQKHVLAHLGKTNKNRYFLLSGSQTSSEESDASSLNQQYQTILDILEDLRNLNPAQLNGSHILANDFLIKKGNLLKAWRVALGTTADHRWKIQVIHPRIGTHIQ